MQFSSINVHLSMQKYVVISRNNFGSLVCNLFLYLTYAIFVCALYVCIYIYVYIKLQFNGVLILSGKKFITSRTRKLLNAN